MKVIVEKKAAVTTIIINRPEVRNAVDPPTAEALTDAFREFEADGDAKVAVLTGADNFFCGGYDLKSVSNGTFHRWETQKDAPMGPSRMKLSKPSIAAVSGYAVAGGLELALLCDLRVMDEDAFFGVFCRRWGAPLVDGGTVRLPRLIGLANALDMILTGRPVGAEEALRMGLANRVVPTGQSREQAEALAQQIAEFPWNCVLSDRRSAYESLDLDFEEAMKNEFTLGLATIKSGETMKGASQFTGGGGRHGSFKQHRKKTNDGA